MAKEFQGAKPTPKKTPSKPVAKKAAGSSARARNTVKVHNAEVVLTALQVRFVEEYLVDLNATQAAIRAGYSAKTAGVVGCENLTKPNIQAAIAEARQKQQERTEITADRVLREAWNQVTADARELTELIVVCCRHCHGDGHLRQRTEIERDYAYALWVAEGEDPDAFPEDGGVGFDSNREPHSNCPECGGHGYPRVVLKDTRKLSRGAASLFAGVKQTKYGIEIQMHSKDAAMEKLFKHLGLYEKDNQQRVDPLASLLHSIANGNSNGFKPVAKDPEHGED
ncbi:Terminase small subunit [Pseudomonas flavescens]|uniref:Terminase small subunit n=1 Tax=Phytopseudomonas flavescens TaxID=29435 RepID=A0A1G7XPJ7_9GAMM|nr:terminase small subunit [Pseudomonas flavescens]SDG86127.1 Terminase small subunit [Pseudomonas flavescens]